MKLTLLLKEFCHKIQKFFLPEIGVVLTAAGQAALTAIGIGAVLSLSGDTSKEKSQAKAQARAAVKAGAFHGNYKSSKKPKHGYKIYDKRTGQIMEYGISGATRTKVDYFKTENNSPRMFAISELYLESLLNLLCNEGINDD